MSCAAQFKHCCLNRPLRGCGKMAIKFSLRSGLRARWAEPLSQPFMEAITCGELEGRRDLVRTIRVNNYRLFKLWERSPRRSTCLILRHSGWRIAVGGQPHCLSLFAATKAKIERDELIKISDRISVNWGRASA